MTDDPSVYTTAWLIERNTPVDGTYARPMWWSNAVGTWVTDAWFAARYSTEVECHRAILFLGLRNEAQAIEHGFGV